MTKTQLNKKLAKLEAIHDQLIAEMKYVDYLLRLVGFTDGLTSVKAVANDMLVAENQEEESL